MSYCVYNCYNVHTTKISDNSLYKVDLFVFVTTVFFTSTKFFYHILQIYRRLSWFVNI
jgi:hypothetical protein